MPPRNRIMPDERFGRLQVVGPAPPQGLQARVHCICVGHPSAWRPSRTRSQAGGHVARRMSRCRPNVSAEADSAGVHGV